MGFINTTFSSFTDIYTLGFDLVPINKLVLDKSTGNFYRKISNGNSTTINEALTEGSCLRITDSENLSLKANVDSVYSKSATNYLLSLKQDNLIPGQNIILDNNNISVSSNLEIPWEKVSQKPSITLGGDLSGTVLLDDLNTSTLIASINSNSVQLGLDTTGNYVAGATAGTGISISGTAGEGWSPTIGLSNAGTAGTYTKVTTDAYGRVTSGTTLSASDIPSLDASKITQNSSNRFVSDIEKTGWTKSGLVQYETKTIALDSFVTIDVSPIFGSNLTIGDLIITAYIKDTDTNSTTYNEYLNAANLITIVWKDNKTIKILNEFTESITIDIIIKA